MLWEFMTVQITLALTAHICSLLIDTLIGELKQTTQVNQFIFNGPVKAGVIGEVKGNLTITQSDSLTMGKEITISPRSFGSTRRKYDEDINFSSQEDIKCKQSILPLSLPFIKQENTVSTTQSVEDQSHVEQIKRVSQKG